MHFLSYFFGLVPVLFKWLFVQSTEAPFEVSDFGLLDSFQCSFLLLLSFFLSFFFSFFLFFLFVVETFRPKISNPVWLT